MKAGRVSLWHPWLDKRGNTHELRTFESTKFTDASSFICDTATHNQYVFCYDILDDKEIPFSTELLRTVFPQDIFISQSSHVLGLRMRKGRGNGYLLPISNWGSLQCDYPSIGTISNIFHRFQFDSLTPSGLSEKVLRDTLPEKNYLHRPTDTLRSTFINNNPGGRIDKKEIAEFFPIVYEYDIVKAYLYFSGEVVNPYEKPQGLYYGDGGKQDNRWQDYKRSWLQVRMVVHGKGIHPIQIREKNGRKRKPYEGEIIETWLWDYELRDCLQKGYTLDYIYRGYGWKTTSTFMQLWADTLYSVYEEVRGNKQEASIIKNMMQGLPGRFLQHPVQYRLIHAREAQKGDTPVLAKGDGLGRLSTDWFIRGSYNLQSAQLTPVGHDIVSQCRHDIYTMQVLESEAGNFPLRAYVDSIAFAQPLTHRARIGGTPGRLKERVYDKGAWVVENQIIPSEFEKARMPGVTGLARRKLWRQYWNA